MIKRRPSIWKRFSPSVWLFSLLGFLQPPDAKAMAVMRVWEERAVGGRG